MLIQYLCMQTSKDLFGLGNLGSDLLVKQAFAVDNASKVLEPFHCLYCCTLMEIEDERAGYPGAAVIILQSFLDW